MQLKKYWFKPKNYGYGVYPISIEGWMLTLIYLIVFFLLGYYFIKIDENVYSFFFFLVLFSVLFIYISRRKTKEEWKWRWGKK